MADLPEELLFDKRLIQRHLRCGLVTQAEVDKHLQATEDLVDECQKLDVDSTLPEPRAGKRPRVYRRQVAKRDPDAD